MPSSYCLCVSILTYKHVHVCAIYFCRPRGGNTKAKKNCPGWVKQPAEKLTCKSLDSYFTISTDFRWSDKLRDKSLLKTGKFV